MQSLFSRQVGIRLAIVLVLTLILLVFFVTRSPTTPANTASLVTQPLVLESEGDVAEQQGIVIANAQPLIIADDRPLLTEPGLAYAKKPTVTKPVSKPVPKPTVEPNRSVLEAAQTSKQVAAPNKPAVSPAPEKRPDAVAPHAKSNLFAGLPDDAWLLQLGSAVSDADAQKRCASLSLPCVGYPAVRNGKQVWILVAGPYSSRDEALSRVSQLPAAIQQQRPFARTVKAVRQDAGL